MPSARGRATIASNDERSRMTVIAADYPFLDILGSMILNVQIQRLKNVGRLGKGR